MIATDVVLEVGFNEHFDETPFRLDLLPSCFLVLRRLNNGFLLFLEVPGFSLHVEFGTLSFGTFLRDA